MPFRYNSNPSAPPMPASYGSDPNQYSYQPSFNPPSSPGYGSGPHQPGVDPEMARAFQMVDKDRSGYIEDAELQHALSSAYKRFTLRTIRLLIFLFRAPSDTSSLRLGFNEFVAVWKCLGDWRSIFERFDQDRSGKMDAAELKNALMSLGYAVPPSVLHLLLSYCGSRSGNKLELSFDNFVEVGTLVKGLTEKFKEKDQRRTGSATMQYDVFLMMVLPFMVTYD